MIRRSPRYVAARREMIEFWETGNPTPCQLMPSSMFMHRIRPHMPLDEINDSLAAADACSSCPIRSACQIVGEDEPYGMWGGVSRSGGIFRRDVSNGDMPMS